MAIQYANKENYDELIKAKFVIVEFYSVACISSKMFSSILEHIASETPFLNIVKVNISSYPELREKCEIQTMPTLFFYRNGKKLEERIGLMQLDELREVVSQYMY